MSSVPNSPSIDIRERLEAVLKREGERGAVLAQRAKIVAFSVIAAWLPFIIPDLAVLYYEVLMSAFIALSIWQMALARRGHYIAWVPYLFIFFEACLLAYTLLVPNPYLEQSSAIQMRLRLDNFIFFYIGVLASGLSYSPALVSWAGVSASIAWSAGVISILLHPDTVTIYGTEKIAILRAHELEAYILHPYFVSIDNWVKQIGLILVLSGILSAVVWRSRKDLSAENSILNPANISPGNR